MEQISNWTQVFLQSVQAALENVLAAIPNIIAAIIFLLIAIIVAKIVQKVFNKLFMLIGINKISTKSGIEGFLLSSGFKKDLSWIFARTLYWFIIILFLLPISDILGLAFFAELINKLISYIPNIIIAMLIILFGTWAAKVLSGMARGSSARLSSEYSQLLGTVVNVTVLIITFVFALSQLNIDASILTSILIILVGAIGLGLAIAFGVGTKDIVKNVTAGIYLNKTLKTGSSIRYKENEVKVIEVGTVSTLIEISEGKQLQVSNSNILESL